MCVWQTLSINGNLPRIDNYSEDSVMLKITIVENVI